MAPVRKSRSVNKRFLNEASPEKDAGSSSKLKQRKKLSDKLGPQWTKGELERFYEAYRKHGKDWKKVAAAVRNNRSADMVEALYNMNRAYLSLPEGTASVVGLIAMMTDHYNVMEGSDSEGEGHDAPGIPQKHQKRKRPKVQLNDSKEDVNQSRSIASTDGCLSFLKQAQAYGTQRRATGKRTPRFPVPNSYRKDDMECSSPPNKRARRSLDSNDAVAHVAALALTGASKNEGSPKVSGTPYRRMELNESSSIRSWGKMFTQRREAQSKHHHVSIYEDRVDGGREKRHEEEAFDKDVNSLMDMEGVGTVEVHRKGKKFYGKKVRVEKSGGNHSDDSGEACSGTEGLRSKSQKGKVDVEVSTGEQRKTSKKLLFGDELDALQALAQLSTSVLPTSLMESESSAQLKEDKTALEMDEKSSTPEATSTNHHEGKPKQLEPKEKDVDAISRLGVGNRRKSKPGKYSPNDGKAVPELKQQPQSAFGIVRRKRKSKMPDAEAPMDSHHIKTTHNEELAKEESKSLGKTKRAGQISAQSKQLKSIKKPEESSSNSSHKGPGTDLAVSTAQFSSINLVGLPTKPSNKRKMRLKRTLQEWAKSSGNTLTTLLNKKTLSEQEQVILQKEKVSSCLSYPLARKWCTYEWFYSAIDYPWFARMEFVDYLNHVGLGHVPRLTRLEWSVIKSSLGRPRRFSEKFLQEEREKLKQYRESVRKHYTELRTGTRDGVPTDLARPLSVGNRVIAIHPETREVHDGKILTVDHEKCSVLFDRTDLGVEFVPDVDCMPSNPWEYMPDALRRQMVSFDNCTSVTKDIQENGHTNCGGTVMFPSSGLENVSLSDKIPMQQLDTERAISQVQASATNDISARQATYTQPYIGTYNKAREAEIQQALALNRTLDKKELEPEILEIIKGSRSKAHAMVDAAIKAVSSMKEGEDAYKKIKEVLGSMDKHQSTTDTTAQAARHQEHANGSLDNHSRSLSTKLEPLSNGSTSQDHSEKSETQLPSELITSCVATWLMIQMCTERQYPPADVAHIIDTAVTSLHPGSPQNLPIYREIQTCMGRIKTQILALIPT